MRSHKAYEHDRAVVMHGDDESVVVTLDIEHHTVIRQEAGSAMGQLDFRWTLPLRTASLCMPDAQRNLSPWMLGPKRPQRAQRNNSHVQSYRAPTVGSILSSTSSAVVRRAPSRRRNDRCCRNSS